jgi:hypothetical protein
MTTLETGSILDVTMVARLVCVGIVLPAHFAVQDSTARIQVNSHNLSARIVRVVHLQ